MGEPNATATPAALAAVSTSRMRPRLREKRLNMPATRFAIVHARCTEGPSLPTERPDAITNGCENVKAVPRRGAARVPA
jgi:hypothetical protein